MEAAADIFPSVRSLVGREWNRQYVADAKARLHGCQAKVDLKQADFFEQEWPKLLRQQTGPVLVLGNPPWVTNSQLGSLGSNNLPAKSNFQRQRGIDAKTGKANFDISQWMITTLLESMPTAGGVLAMLCKTAVARKVLQQAWNSALPLARCSIRGIDSRRHFRAAVDACLLTCEVRPGEHPQTCEVFANLEDTRAESTLGIYEGRLLADRNALERHRHLLETESNKRWRSGVKHDCRDVMQLQRRGWSLVNGLGETVELEPDYLFPMMPAGKIHRGETRQTDQFLLVPQSHTGEDTSTIESKAPRTWAYLRRHADRLAARKSSIYRGRPPFSIFGIGEYSFARWKVAISALHKQLSFRVVGPQEGRPVMMDDTTYFLSLRTRKEATQVATWLNSAEVQEFLTAWIFWDAKRPITTDVLQRLRSF